MALADLKRALGKLHRRIRLIGLRFQLQAGGRILEDAHALRLRLIAVRLNQNAHAQEHLARVDQAAVRAADAAAHERLRVLADFKRRSCNFCTILNKHFCE